MANGPLSLKAICDAAEKGVGKAFKDYEFMSGDNYRNAIPESYFQSKIADQIANLKGNFYVTMEYLYADILELAKAHPNAVKPFRKLRQRADVVVWSAKGIPKHIIEVKIAKAKTGMMADRKKIQAALKPESKLIGGIVIGAYYGTYKENIEKNINEFSKVSGVTLKNKHIDPYGNNENGLPVYAGCGVFAIK